jgi:pimeloyl-ACP methyl ester carboxylesterase
MVGVMASTNPVPTGRLIDTGTGKLYAHLREGAGPTLVFLHYWGGSHRTWRPVIDHLAPEQAYTAHDHRGWGQSSDVTGPFHLEQLADDTQILITTLELADYVLVGHSMGGKTAQLLAARRPAGLRGVVLVAPAPPAPAIMTPALQDSLVHAYDDAARVAAALDTALTHRNLPSDLRRQVVVDSLASGEPDARLAWPRHGIVADISARVAAIDVPVLVLAGDHDRVDPPQVLTDHLLPHIPHAQLAVLAGTGHLSPLEVPDQLASHIARFLTHLPR